jgi:long-chain acyl-CoA synthetase
MIGYYHQPEATAAVVRDGWLYTGDVGRIDRDGYLTLTDRKKALLKTAYGKYVAPQPIEALLKRDPLVAEAMLIGEGRRFVSVVLVPSFPLLESRAKALGIAASTREELVQNPSILRLLQTVVDTVNRDLAPFEQIKRFLLLPTEFSIDSGELTPTLKVKRRVVEEKWGKEIEGMYAAKS